MFIEKIREYEKTGLTLDKSVIHEYTTEDFNEAIREHAFEEGRKEGREEMQGIIASQAAEIARLNAQVSANHQLPKKQLADN